MNLNLIHEAVVFATEAHEGQTRKTSKVAYISHPLTAALYAQRYLLDTSFTEEEQTNIVAAIILHDVWEDTDVTLDAIEEKFGSAIAKLVKGASEEDKSKTWLERKTATIKKTTGAPLDLKYIICADKVHNLVSMVEAQELIGEEMWKSFKERKETQQWYYTNMYKALLDGVDHVPAFFQEMKRQIELVFGE
ncbi:(p)ppGpp synthase/HD superfamily hydrolase [Evansella vedderi]|uniref:(P)ppGpp synthase/HD superfamily hydrolase n=1 Tax=Evansella vedderi TaxID=38282 RepID=A0ABT9ZVB4_9BACI|nr:HD domain-containing protein [Evansella vedderi]MDQ0255182.1 (p)ppGpp synthase/HD superfamily hydrolase [Evansella vedderi]